FCDHWKIDFEQTYRGVIVDGPSLRGISDGRSLGLEVRLSVTGEFVGADDRFYRGLRCDANPRGGEEEAIRIAKESVPEEGTFWAGLWRRLRTLPPSRGRLVGEVQVGHVGVDVDARDGSVISRRVTFSCRGGRCPASPRKARPPSRR